MMGFYKRYRSLPYSLLLGFFALGFVSGLPFLLTLSTLSFWLAEVGVSKTTVGLFMLVGVPYCVKFLWAPAIDTLKPPLLWRWFSQRRGWALLSQIGLIASLLLLSQTNPIENIYLTAIGAFLVSLFAASQDIIVDAYRIEMLTNQYLGFGAAVESTGFRFGMLASGAGALYLAHIFSWEAAYAFMAAAVTIGMGAIFLMPDQLYPPLSVPSSFRNLMVPWRSVFQHKNIVWLVLFIFAFKMGDTVLNAMSAPFLVDLGFTKLEFANVTKVFGITLMILGSFGGGWMIYRWNLASTLMICMVLQVTACLLFVLQSWVGHDLNFLMVTVGVESFCSGMTASAFIAYLSSFCSPPSTATHFTVLYSINSLCRVGTSALAGWMADQVGWNLLFIFPCFAILPAAVALIYLELQTQKQPLTSKACQVL